MNSLRFGVVASLLMLLAGCAQHVDGDASSSASVVVVESDATADVQQAWHLVEKSAEVDLGGGQALLGFLTPRPASELHAFLVASSTEIFGEGLGALLAHADVSGEGGSELLVEFNGFGIARGDLGIDAQHAFEAVTAALAHVEVEHAWYLHGRSPASGSDYLVIRDRNGMMWGFFVGIVG